MARERPYRGRCPFPGCSRRRAARPPKLVGHRYSLVPLKFCGWHLNEANRVSPAQRRARILAACGDGPEAFSSRNMDRPPHVAATSRPMLRLADSASLSPLWRYRLSVPSLEDGPGCFGVVGSDPPPKGGWLAPAAAKKRRPMLRLQCGSLPTDLSLREGWPSDALALDAVRRPPVAASAVFLARMVPKMDVRATRPPSRGQSHTCFPAFAWVSLQTSETPADSTSARAST